jgi:hypothetical protein
MPALIEKSVVLHCTVIKSEVCVRAQAQQEWRHTALHCACTRSGTTRMTSHGVALRVYALRHNTNGVTQRCTAYLNNNKTRNNKQHKIASRDTATVALHYVQVLQRQV